MLDLAVARAVRQAKLLERVVHDTGPWSLRVDGIEVPMMKAVGDTRVVFLAAFPPACWVGSPPRVADLLCRGDVVDTRTIDLPAEGPYTLEWTVRLADTEIVTA